MIPKHIMESKLITDEQWEEYQRLKEENQRMETWNYFLLEESRNNQKKINDALYMLENSEWYTMLRQGFIRKLIKVLKGEI